MLNDICRVCLNSESLISLFHKPESIMWSTILMSIANVTIRSDDGLPSFICSECSTKLVECYKFKRQCEDSDTKLRSLAKFDNSDVNKSLIINDDSCLNTSKTDELDNDSNLEDNSEDIREDTNPSICLKHRINVPIVGAQASPHDEGVRSLLHHGNSNDQKLTECEIKTRIRRKRKLEKQQCSTCGKVMSSRFRLDTHLKTHTGEKPFVCSHCNKTFSLEQSLKVHLRVHSGEKPLRCTICGQCFAQTSGLAVHYRKHTGVLPYKCTLCPNQYRTVGHLQYHIRQHTGEKNFECDTCGRAFINRSVLKQHSRTHSGEKPMVCSVCGSRFTRASHLKRHAAKHCGNKPFACGVCPSKFNQRVDFDKHMKKHDVMPDLHGAFGTPNGNGAGDANTTLKA